MDQAVLACVKSYQKRCFYHKLFCYCESNHGQPNVFQLFLKSYTILDAIKDIEKGWQQVPESTIQKSFRKVFPMKKWEELCGHDFEGFTGEEHRTTIPIDFCPGQEGAVRSQVINDDFETHIQEMHAHLNGCVQGVVFDKDHIIEDVLFNPGPKDDNIDNIIREVLNVQDETCPEEDTNEVDNVPVQQDDDDDDDSTTTTVWLINLGVRV